MGEAGFGGGFRMHFVLQKPHVGKFFVERRKKRFFFHVFVAYKRFVP